MSVLGIALLRRFAAFLQPLETTAYGIPLGVVTASLTLVPFANISGTSATLAVSGAALSVAVAFLVWPGPIVFPGATLQRRRDRCTARGNLSALVSRPTRIPLRWSYLPALVVGCFITRWALFWSTALTFEADGLWASQINIWGDWTQHLGDVASFVYGGNMPPDHPRFAGHTYPYHYLAAFTSALMVELGMTPITALTLHSFLFSVLITLGIYAFATRLTGSRGVAALTLVLFFLGGTLGWSLILADIDSAHSVLGPVLQNPWNQTRQEAANFRWQNMYFSLIAPQRGYLYGLPLSLLIFTLLLEAVQTRQNRLFVVAGVVAGLLPLAHLSTLLALALITPFIALLFPSSRWLLFFVVWVALAVPQLYFQQGGEPGATSALRLQLGWVAAPDPWLWFWLKNLGWFLPLLAIALASRTLVPAASRRLLWAFMPAFIVTNVLVFQPWDWDNIKFMLYWFLAVSILVAALLVRAWREYSSPLVRTLISVAVATMIMSGVLLNLQQMLGKDRALLLTNEELELAMAVRAKTPPQSVFVAGLQHNHPVAVLSGRRVVMGYPGPLWAQGLDYVERERDVQAIYAFAPNTPELLSKYGVDYVVIGPYERDRLGANVTEYRDRYPTVIATPQYEIFAVKGG